MELGCWLASLMTCCSLGLAFVRAATPATTLHRLGFGFGFGFGFGLGLGLGLGLGYGQGQRPAAVGAVDGVSQGPRLGDHLAAAHLGWQVVHVGVEVRLDVAVRGAPFHGDEPLLEARVGGVVPQLERLAVRSEWVGEWASEWASEWVGE